MTELPAEVQAFVDALPATSRPLFDRVHGLILGQHPDAGVRLAYKMPTYDVGERALHVGVWKHGVSFYGWDEGRDGALAERHPEWSSGRGTLRLPRKAAAEVSDDELLAFFRAVFAP